MKARTTIFLLLLAAGIYVFIRLYDQNNLSTREAKEQSAQVFARFDRDKLKEIEIKTGDDHIELQKKDNTWYLDVPVRDRADPGAVTRLLTSLETLRSKARIEGAAKDKIKEFGLNKPAIRVRFEGEDIPSRFAIGGDTAASGDGAFYARIADRDTVHVVEGDLKQQLQQSADDFRDRRLISARTTDATRLVIHLQNGDVEVINEGGEWMLTKPFKARGASQKIRDLIASLTSARIEDFVAGDKNKEDDGLTEPAGSVDLYFDGSDEPETVKFGRSPAKNPDNIYASLSSRIGVFAISKSAASILDQQPNDLRDRNLVRINPDIVDRLTITSAKGAPVQLARQGEDWIIRGDDPRPAHGPEVLAFIDRLRNETVREFVAETASDLAKYGLAQPEVQVSFSSYASGNTAESAAGENVITTITFARPADGRPAYAHVEEEPFVVGLDPQFVERIPTSAAQWRSPVVKNFDPASIDTIGVETTGGEPVTFTRQQETWSSSGSAANQVAVQSLANTLAKLRAVRWIGDTSPEQGLQDPEMRVTVTAAGKTESLLIGNTTPDQMHFAQYEGDSGVFLMSDPDYRTIIAVDGPAAPSPAAETDSD